jgi:CRP-like cAMP-binding protein/serine/threonine protein phosphatase PrpC
MDIVTSTVFFPGRPAGRAHMDQVLVLPKQGLLAVADAISEGEERRAGIRIALETLRSNLDRQEDIFQRFRRHPTPELRARILTIIEDSFARAAQEVFAYARRFDDLRITLDCVLMLPPEAFVGHVGDGRVFLVRRGLVHQLTVDHSTGEDEVFADMDEEPQAAGEGKEDSGDRRLVRALGPEPSVRVESLCMELADNDRFVLDTWGVHQAIPEGVLHHLMLTTSLDALGPALKRSAPDAPLVAACGQLGGGDPEVMDSGRSRLAILAPIPLFAHCTERELRSIASATHPRQFTAGTRLFKQGDPGTELYLVISGAIRIERDGKVIVTLGPGSNFGEMALLDQPSRSASAITEEDCEVMVISRESFFAMLRDNPMLAVKILWNMALRLSANLRTTSGALAKAKRDLMQEESLEAAAETALAAAEAEEAYEELDAETVKSPPPREVAPPPREEDAVAAPPDDDDDLIAAPPDDDYDEVEFVMEPADEESEDTEY